VHPVFAVTLSTFSTCYVGEIMIPCQVSTFSELICGAFQFHGHLAQKIIKYMKKGNEFRKGFEIDDVALNGAY
jgi:hypothetical protein